MDHHPVAFLRSRGHCRFTYADNRGRVCALGALYAANYRFWCIADVDRDYELEAKIGFALLEQHGIDVKTARQRGWMFETPENKYDPCVPMIQDNSLTTTEMVDAALVKVFGEPL